MPKDKKDGKKTQNLHYSRSQDSHPSTSNSFVMPGSSQSSIPMIAASQDDIFEEGSQYNFGNSFYDLTSKS